MLLLGFAPANLSRIVASSALISSIRAHQSSRDTISAGVWGCRRSRYRVFNSCNSRISILRVRTRSRMDSASIHLQSSQHTLAPCAGCYLVLLVRMRAIYFSCQRSPARGLRSSAVSRRRVVRGGDSLWDTFPPKAAHFRMPGTRRTLPWQCENGHPP